MCSGKKEQKMSGFEAIRAVNEMCIESCDPETFEAWEKVKSILFENRNSLKHHHNAMGDDPDTCAICGYNFRSQLHI